MFSSNRYVLSSNYFISVINGIFFVELIFDWWIMMKNSMNPLSISGSSLCIMMWAYWSWINIDELYLNWFKYLSVSSSMLNHGELLKYFYIDVLVSWDLKHRIQIVINWIRILNVMWIHLKGGSTNLLVMWLWIQWCYDYHVLKFIYM